MVKVWKVRIVPKKVPGWFWGVLGVLVMAWFAYWIGRGK